MTDGLARPSGGRHLSEPTCGQLAAAAAGSPQAEVGAPMPWGPGGRPSGWHRWRWASVAYLLAWARGAEAACVGGNLGPGATRSDALLRGPGRTLLNEGRTPAQLRPPRHELVLSRPAKEQIAWIFKVPDFWQITVYTNQTPQQQPFWPPDLSPQGRWQWQQVDHNSFGQAFAHHLHQRYTSLADYTVFSPAFPLEQSPSLLDMMTHPALLARVQAMSLRVTAQLPPGHIVASDRADVWYRAQRFSLRTLEPIEFVDPNVRWAARAYRNASRLAPNVNLLRHFILGLGVEQSWLTEETEVGSFAYGGLVGFTRPAALQHAREVYQQLEQRAALEGAYTPIIERAWLMILAGDRYHEARPEVGWRRRPVVVDDAGHRS